MALHTDLTPKPGDAVAKVALAALRTARSALTSGNGTVYISNGDGTGTMIGQGGGRDETGGPNGLVQFVGDKTVPGRPTGVGASSSGGVVTVSWTGGLEGGMPADFSHVNIYITASGSTRLLGRMRRPGAIATAEYPPGTLCEVWSTAEDLAADPSGYPDHNISDRSETVSVVVEDSGADALQLKTLVRETERGIEVGKSADGESFATARAVVSGDATFDILDRSGTVLSRFSRSEINLGRTTPSSVVKMCGGTTSMRYDAIAQELSLDAIGLNQSGRTVLAIAASNNYSGSAHHAFLQLEAGTKESDNVTGKTGSNLIIGADNIYPRMSSLRCSPLELVNSARSVTDLKTVAATQTWSDIKISAKYRAGWVFLKVWRDQSGEALSWNNKESKIGSLPAGFRPKEDIWEYCGSNAQSGAWLYAIVHPDGNIALKHRYGNAEQGWGIFFANFAFPAS